MDPLGIAGAVGGLVGALAAVGAVWYARKAALIGQAAIEEQRMGTRVGDERHAVADSRHAAAEIQHRHALQPRPIFTFHSSNDPFGVLTYSFANAGGAAVTWIAHVLDHGRLYWVQTAVPAHYAAGAGTRISSQPIAAVAVPTDHPSLTSSFAQDVEGWWWDCLAGVRVSEDLRTGSIAAKLLAAGLTAAEVEPVINLLAETESP